MNLERSMFYMKLHAKAFFRSKSGVFFLILLPVIFILLFGAIFGGNSTQKSTLAVQDLSATQGSSNFTVELTTALNESGLFNLVFISPSQNISSYMQKNSINQGMIIPANFSSDMKKNGSGYLEYISNPSDSYSVALGPVIQNVVLRITSGNSSSVQVLNVPISRNIPKPVDYYIPGLVGFTLANAIFAMVYLVPAYRKKKIFRQLEFSGLTKGEWLFSMVIFYFLLTLLSDLVLLVTGYLVFGIHLSVSVLDVVLSLVTIFVGVLLFISIGLLAGLLSKNEESANLIANVIFFPMLFLSGVFFPQSFMPSYLVSISNFLPLTYMIKVLVDLLLFSEIATAIPYIIALGAGSLAVFFVSAYLAMKADIG